MEILILFKGNNNAVNFLKEKYLVRTEIINFHNFIHIKKLKFT